MVEFATGLQDTGPFLSRWDKSDYPGTYEALLKADAAKKASYLSQMDQFYAGLEESSRQFDETLGFKTETRDLELGFSREQLAQQKELAMIGFDIQREELASMEKYRSTMGDVATGGLEIRRGQFGLEEAGFEQQSDWLNFLRGSYEGGAGDGGTTSIGGTTRQLRFPLGRSIGLTEERRRITSGSVPVVRQSGSSSVTPSGASNWWDRY